ncbi:MAG: site-specific integrase [Malacoplasma sp.]
MNNKLLTRNYLIEQVKAELLRLRYKKDRIRLYNLIWIKLDQYMENRNLDYFDMNIGLNFLEYEYNLTVFNNLNSCNNIKVRAINMLGEFQLHGMILSKRRKVSTEYYKVVNKCFSNFLESRRLYGISEKTLKSNELYLSRFSEYLSKYKLENISEINNNHILGFINTLAGTSKATIYCTLCTLRVLLRYLHTEKFVETDFSYIVPKINIDKTSRVPSAYSKDEIEKLLGSIDRGSPKGKRDYAMILLASRLGMRAGDICCLSFKNIKWEHNTLEFIQQKTNKKAILPLTSEVGSALINYLKYGRPINDSNNIFVRHTCPISPLTPPTLHSIVWKAMQGAEIYIPNGKKHGPHSLRHSLASALLEENVPLHVISEVLGHSNTDTTAIYLKINVDQLRNCALDINDFEWNKLTDGGESYVL